MGQSESSLPLKRFVNDPRDIVNDGLEGLLWASPHLCLLDGFPEVKVVARADWKKDAVAIVAGGGAGHEPADAGFVGEGMLTAAVCGEIFTSPPADAVAQALVAVTGPAGALVVVRNGIGNRLNFLAGVKEATKRHGCRVRFLQVADDLSTAQDLSGRTDFRDARGMAGLHLVVKVAGAASQAGLGLDAVYDEAAAMAKAVRTQGVAFSSCSVPGQPNPHPIPADQMEVGVGIHGEPGVSRVKADASARDIVDIMVSRLRQDLPSEGPLCVLVNNLGAVPHLEMSILTAQVMRSQIAERVRLLIGPAHFLTSLEMNGVSLTVAPLDAQSTERLCAPTACRSWPPAVVPQRPHMPAATQQRGLGFPPSENTAVSERFLRACAAICQSAQELNRLDAHLSNGDCGRNLAHAVRRVRAAHHELPLNEPGPFCLSVAQLLRGAEGALSALVSVFFLEAGKAMGRCGAWGPEVVPAFEAGQQAVQTLAEFSEGMRTFMDALGPALRAAREGWAAMALAAQNGARATAFMTGATGRAAYASSDQRRGIPDAGAMAVALVITAVAAPEAGALSFVEDDAAVHERFDVGEVIGEGSFGVVHEAVDSSGAHVAIKVSRRGQESGPRSFASLDFLGQRHMCNWLFSTKAHIARMHEVLVTPGSVYIVMERLTGPQLSDWLMAERSSLSERHVAQVARQILLAASDIHAYGMVHRDLKVENFRFTDADARELKLVDIVGTMVFQADDAPKSVCGTASYLSPEAILGECSPAVDMWAIGVLIYLMICGRFPFEATTLAELLEQHKQPPCTDGHPWHGVSDAGKEAVRTLLEFKPGARPTAEQLLCGQWLSDGDALSCEALELGVDAIPRCMHLSRLINLRSEEALATVKTLYLVRHGEAEHNVCEREARQRAELEASLRGHAKDSPELKSAAEEARREALRDEAFRDAALSPTGKAMALDAQALINRLQSQGFPRPARILVSPLERTLQTAAIIFPRHPSTHVVESLRERRTGLPCDECKCGAKETAQRRTFNHMSFNQVLCLRHQDNGLVEGSPELRDRAKEVMQMLRSCDDGVLALVTHKAFLRELEHGPLGKPEAKEFGNCEVRVYDVTFASDGGVLCRLRYCRG